LTEIDKQISILLGVSDLRR